MKLHTQSLEQMRKEKARKKGRVTPFVLSAAIHAALLLLFTVVVVIPKLQDTPEIVATYVVSEREVVPRMVQEEVAEQFRKSQPSSASAQMANIIQASVPAPVGLPQVEAAPPDMPVGLGVASQSGPAGLGSRGGPGGGSSGFGSTKEMRGAFEGTIYTFDFIDRIRQGSRWFTGKNKQQKAGKIYTYAFNVDGRNFDKGFPGISRQFEWFAIDYKTTLEWPESWAGLYEWELQVDDGAIFQIDGRDVIDYDGPHGWGAPKAYGSRHMTGGKHTFRLVYYQGPRYYVGLILKYRKGGEVDWRLFDAREIRRASIKTADHPLK